jgi:hypothetical protein
MLYALKVLMLLLLAGCAENARPKKVALEYVDNKSEQRSIQLAEGAVQKIKVGDEVLYITITHGRVLIQRYTEEDAKPRIIVVDKRVESSYYRLGLRNGALAIEHVPEKHIITIQPCIDGEPDGPKERIEVPLRAYDRIRLKMQCDRDFIKRQIEADDPFRFG